jgi:hypothetical protein
MERNPGIVLLFFVLGCAGIAMVHGATRGTTLAEILRETWSAFVAYAGGVALLCAVLWMIVAAAQG